MDNTGYNKFSDSQFLNILGLSQINIKWAITISLIAIGIKLTKTQYLQQQENIEIARKKSMTELQLQKARINPALLFNSLDNIYQKIHSGSDDAAVMVLKLSELLSYSLYESDEEFVLLDHELSGINDLIYLEKAHSQKNIHFDMKVIGNTVNKYTVPALLPLLQDCINLIAHEKKGISTLSFHINADRDDLSIKLLLSSDDFQSKRSNLAAILTKLRQRLSLIKIPDSYHFNLKELDQQDGLAFDLPLTDSNKVKIKSSPTMQSISYDRA